MSELSAHDSAVLNCIFNPNLPLEDVVVQAVLEDVEEDTVELRNSTALEVQAINAAENGDLDKAIGILNQALEITPQKASLYNNRAHVYQYQRKFEAAMDDLSKAIELAGENQKKTLCQAHCQRGVLYKKESKVDEARNDFEIAAKLGNSFAKSQLVELNPYAALCNQMLKKVMDTI